MKSEWFKDWFNTEEYLDVYKHRNEADAQQHIELILNNIPVKQNADVLDMACGAGRHAIILSRKGFNITAVDLSENLLSVARQISKTENLKINFVHSDIRDFTTNIKFQLVLNLFTSFGYFETDEENFAVLKKAYNFLDDKGYFVLDYFNSEYLKNNLIESSKDNVNGEEIIQERKIEKSRIVKNINIIRNGESQQFEESVRMYSKDELTIVLNKIGFDIYKTFGDFFGNEFNQLKSPRLILICKK